MASLSAAGRFAGVLLAAAGALSPAAAQVVEIPPEPEAAAPAPPRDTKLSNAVAVFAGLDKITGRIIAFDVYIDETVQFGALRVTPRVCYSRPSSETPQTDGFVEVDEITLDNRIQRIFTGWMFAASPGLNAVDHAIYDVWLTDCRASSDVAPPEGFDMSRFSEDEVELIERPPGWFPLPLPKPLIIPPSTDAPVADSPGPDSDAPED
ncbi:DUF2155 domain-containing protein [Pseudoxanthobacter sp. M-2]|uniref:DUF2155 domain-containing protein n=1 Tax=Pseudoxanthobacter sp. M-2 TaxID=3078754 RepID=UPI0038FC5C19